MGRGVEGGRKASDPFVILRIGVLHHDMAFGGAERVMIAATRSLQAAGHRVTLFTTQIDASRSFEGARESGLEICVFAPAWPPHIAGRLRAPSVIVRMASLAARAARQGPFDVLLCDQVAHIIPRLKRISQAKIAFYCHFPDRLLTAAHSIPHRLYRRSIDRLEASGMLVADAVLVNSRFTADAVEQSFPQLPRRSVHVVYPGIDLSGYAASGVAARPASGEIIVLSLNRFKPEKNHMLAIGAFARLRQRVPYSVFDLLRLMIAGGFDAADPPDRRTLRDLQQFARNRGVAEHVRFLPNCPEDERLKLLRTCRAFVYTALGEHFGLAPVEAMAAGRPVVASASGGLLETVQNGETGFLCEPEEAAFADALARLILDPASADRMGSAGRKRAEDFSLEKFSARINSVIEALANPDQRQSE